MECIIEILMMISEKNDWNTKMVIYIINKRLHKTEFYLSNHFPFCKEERFPLTIFRPNDHFWWKWKRKGETTGDYHRARLYQWLQFVVTRWLQVQKFWVVYPFLMFWISLLPFMYLLMLTMLRLLFVQCRYTLRKWTDKPWIALGAVLWSQYFLKNKDSERWEKFNYKHY